MSRTGSATLPIPDRVDAWGAQSFPASDPHSAWAGSDAAVAVSPAPELVVFTVGHSTHAAEEFLDLLGSAGIEAIADIRRYPGSRRFPHFNVEALSESLAGVGIAYLPLGAELGGRRKPRATPATAAGEWRSFRATRTTWAPRSSSSASPPWSARPASEDWR